jgi:ADP-heptose:LPS heptosyltransferase/GT2 family glycosyltransferase
MMGLLPEISIIMPTYNRAKFIGETIKSIQSQTYPNWELIIIDDGSDDDTEKIISEINDKRIKFYKAGRIGMSAKIRNFGLEKAAGEFIAFADSDDLWAPRKLEKQLNAFQQYPEAGFCLTGGYNFKKQNEPLEYFYRQREGVRYGNLFIAFFNSEAAATTPTLMVKKECLKITGLLDETKPVPHVDFILSFALHFKGIILYEPLFYRRLHDSNYSSLNAIKRHNDGIRMIRSYKKFLPHKLLVDSLFRSHINFGEKCVADNNRKQAISQFLQAWKRKPFSIIPLKKIAKTFLKWMIHAEENNLHGISSKPWTRNKPPKRILAIRLQAMGDVVATLPYLQDLRNKLPPHVKLDFLTRKECEDIPKNIFLFDKIVSIHGGRRFKKQLLFVLFLLPKLLLRRYDVVIDLQNNELTRLVKKVIRPKAWSEFDRYSSIPGGERYRMTIEATGIRKNTAANNFCLKNLDKGRQILFEQGWTEKDELIVFNPAGAFETRNWDINNYVGFARLWLNRYPHSKFLIIGTSFIASKAKFLKDKLGNQLINLVEKTTPSEAFAILQNVKLILSEDSGLMHMGWGSGIPTIGLFGSTRTDWVRPLGEHTFFLDSSDLFCGGCMQEICRFRDVHCLTRYTPELIFDHACSLLKKLDAVKENN